ncbi:MAG: hypothetical protein CMQ24_12945 [Gammaproteobacteria bacterium]|nr:hypothetical protein [Gammaproteobacteria bacterium]
MDRTATEGILRRLLKGGRMRRLPRSRKDTEVFLAIAALSFHPRGILAEADINEHLTEWLEPFASIDHVTLRRCLVDHGMLLRDAAGNNYRANQAVISKAIEPDVRSLLPGDILDALERERAERKRATGQAERDVS